MSMFEKVDFGWSALEAARKMAKRLDMIERRHYELLQLFISFTPAETGFWHELKETEKRWRQEDDA